MKTPETFYRDEIRILEKLYLENQPDDIIWGKFVKDCINHFKIQITFDNRFSDVFRQYFTSIVDSLSGSEQFIKKVLWVDRLNQIFRERKFISKREFHKIRDKIQSIKNSPSTDWLERLPYIRSSKTIHEFRGQFLVQLCNVDEQTAEELAQDAENNSPQAIQQIRKHYTTFFQQCLQENVSRKIASFVESEWAAWEIKGEMLPAKLISDLDRHLGVSDVGSNEKEVKINKILVEIAQNSLYQNDRDIKQRLDNEVQLIEKALQKFSGLNIIKDKDLTLRVGKFGSLISGFASTDADLDLTILTNCYVKEDEFLKVLHQFLKKEYQEGDRRSNTRRVQPELIITAKTPLITITITEKGSAIKIDIIVNNILGVVNSKFLKVYASVRWVKNLGILVKLWGKLVGLIDKKALSSYAMILMLIHYLIRFKYVKPIMDARNRTNDSPHFQFKRIKQNQVQKFNVFYVFKNRPEDVTNVQRVNYYRILEGFFKYYAYDIWKSDSQTNRIITVDQSTNKEVDKETVLTIKDPFDQPHNPGRLKIESKEFLIQGFKEAHNSLLSIKDDTKLTDEARQQRVKNIFT